MTQVIGVTTSSSDAELLSAVRSGNAKAYGMLYERHALAASRLARQIVSRPPDVDDVVAETFARILGAIWRGAGPSHAFRPYLLTSVRRVAFDQLRMQRDQVPTEEADIPDPGEPFVDPAVASLERSLIARAFMSLPERWSAVLWHTEIEQARPAEVALLLGITPNGVAALCYRAREGLRQAYLQLHLSSEARAECMPVACKLGAHVRGGLSARDTRRVDAHLRSCGDCKAAHAELAIINGSLRAALAPVILGGQAAAYLKGSGHVAAWHGLAALAARLLRRLTSHGPVVAGAAGVVATAILLPAATLVHPHQGVPHAVTPIGSPRGGATARFGRSSGSSHDPARSGHPTSPSASPSGTPAPSPGGSPTASPGSSPSASPNPRSSLKLTAKVGVGVDVSGLLNLGLATVVAVHVSDPGGAPTSAGLTANLTLPSGTVMLGLSGSSAWSCTTGSASATCTHGAIAAGATTSVSFRVLVVSLSGCGNSVLATVVSGGLSATGISTAQEQCGVPLL